jgi:hypothetical protein
VLVGILMRARAPVTVADLVDAVEARGHEIGGRPGKVVSDALRWEVRHNRVARVDDDAYVVRPMSRQLRHRMRRRAVEIDAAARATAPSGHDRW